MKKNFVKFCKSFQIDKSYYPLLTANCCNTKRVQRILPHTHPFPPSLSFIFIQFPPQSVALLVTVVDYDRVGGNEPIGKH